MALILAFGFAAVEQIRSLPTVFAVALLLTLAAGQPMRVLRGLRGPLVLAAVCLLIFPLIAGSTVLWQAGPLRLRAEGLETGLLVAGRLLAIVSVTLALLATLPADRLATALRGIGVPALMADLLLLTLRYLDEVRGELLRARLARHLRGGGAGWRDLPGHGTLLAIALIRSQRRAEHIWAAMRLRGHGARPNAPQPPLGARHLAGIGLAAGLAGLMLLVDRAA